MPRILALETSSNACSVALLTGQQTLSRTLDEPRQHAKMILSLCQELLNEAGTSLGALDCIAFGQGPGSFTGVRIAISVAQGLAFGHDLPMVGVSSLQALAQAAHRQFDDHQVLVAVDARMQEVYWGAYEFHNERMQVLDQEFVSAPESVVASGTHWVGVGNGWAAYPDAFTGLQKTIQAYRNLSMDALDIAYLAQLEFNENGGLAPHEVSPVYLRNQVTG